MTAPTPAPQAEGDVREQLADVIGTSNLVPFYASSQVARSLSLELADAVLSSDLVVPAEIHKVATDALEAGDACGAVGCRALIERDAARTELAQVTQWHDEVRQECAELRGGVGAIKAEALREAARDIQQSIGHEIRHDAAIGSEWAKAFISCTALDAAALLERADALSGTTDEIGDGTSEGDQG